MNPSHCSFTDDSQVETELEIAEAEQQQQLQRKCVHHQWHQQQQHTKSYSLSYSSSGHIHTDREQKHQKANVNTREKEGRERWRLYGCCCWQPCSSQQVFAVFLHSKQSVRREAGRQAWPDHSGSNQSISYRLLFLSLSLFLCLILYPPLSASELPRARAQERS